MKKACVTFLIVALAVLNSAAGSQTPATQSQQNPPSRRTTQSGDLSVKDQGKQDQEVIRLGVTLVQVDVVVVDGKNQQITDLKPEDFEILEDGQPQRISNFSYIALPTRTSEKAEIRTEKEGPTLPMRLRPEQVRRTIAFVVDDLGMSFDSMPGVRTAIKKFVNEQMQPGDVVAILRTGTGIGALQQFTSDKRQLVLAAERLKWNPNTRTGITTLPNVDTAPRQSDGGLTEDVSQGREDLDLHRSDIYSFGTIETLNLVVRGLRHMPGRKSVIVFSDGLELRSGSRDLNNRATAALEQIIDLANRSSVVFYTIDSGGLQPLNFTAGDAKTTVHGDTTVADRRNLHFRLSDGLAYLARETGGIFTKGGNDLARGIERAIDDQKGYYLIGYTRASKLAARPAVVSRPNRIPKVEVKVKRVGYQVRSRNNFFALAAEDINPAAANPDQQLLRAITSPFSSADLHVKLTALFARDNNRGLFVRSLAYIDAREITFQEQPDGTRKGEIEIIAVTFGENGQVVDHIAKGYQISIRPDRFSEMVREGFIYTVLVPIKKPGAYQLRLAVRDAANSRLGTASQFIDVPDISKRRLALSGIAAMGTDPKREAKSALAERLASDKEGSVEEQDTQASPAVRRLRRGTFLDYGLYIYNAVVDATAGKADLETQASLFRDGKAVYTGKPLPVVTGQATDLRSIEIGGRIVLPDSLEAGDYSLQIVVTDKLASKKFKTASQWIDFELVK